MREHSKDMVMGGTGGTGYQLGSDAAELERLNRQGRVLAPATRSILDAAGIRPGMRVLDELSARMAQFESNGRLVLAAEALIGTGIKSAA